MESREADQSKEERVARRIIEILMKSRPDRMDLTRIKHAVSAEEGLDRVLKNHEILKYLREDERKTDIVALLVGKRVRSASGIYTVAVMTKPSRCPKERPCYYCPGGVDYGTPQSYFGREPALMRGIQSNFDPYKQVMYRLTQYSMIGHRPSKIQLIIMGGTFPATDLDYQEWFVTRCLEAMNDYPTSRPYRWSSLEEAQARNERSRVRCIGITMETRPDWAKEVQTDRMLRLGATLVDVGVQALDDRILRGVNRGCTVEDVKEATRILRDSGLKVGYHMMPG
ncbi:MAG: radical SAM protein, partial [Candidatus Methanomethylicaceae archaeon]